MNHEVKTLLAFADHGSVGELMASDGGDPEEVLAKFAEAALTMTSSALISSDKPPSHL